MAWGPSPDGGGPSSDGAGWIVHGTSLVVAGQGVLIEGPSGSGKSALALQLLALGARLIADDRTRLTPQPGRIDLSAPDTIRGLIEARGVGILRTEPAPPAPLALIVDLSQHEEERLPPQRIRQVLEHRIPILYGLNAPHFAAALMVYLKGGRVE